MEPNDVSNVFAIVLMIALIATVGASATRSTRSRLSHLAPAAAASAAIGATLGSLYFSEVAGYVPCTLCWYQRIAMYPIAVVLLIAVVLRDRTALWYSLALSAGGLAVSIYHIQLQLFPDRSSNACEITSPCTATWVEAFGFATIPQMAAATFVLIVLLSVIGLRGVRRADAEVDEPVDRAMAQ